MKLFKSTLLTLALLGLFNFTVAQQTIAIQKADENSVQSSAPYRIDPQPLLREIDKKYGIDYTKAEPANRLAKATAWNFNVGSTKTWWASNFDTNEFYQVSSTCRGVGTNCYIFVEDALWGSKVDQAAVNAVQNVFDNSTPANPSKGVYRTDVETFGNPPDVDNDPKIVILILDIKDGYIAGSNGGFVAGYFHSVNEVTDVHSNKAEIYYLDANPTALDTPGGLNTAMSTTAHEFQHMIHYNYHKSSAETFFNEGMSLIAEYVNGYNLREQSRYTKETNHYLLDWRRDDNVSVLIDYSRAARFAAYMYDQYGLPFLKSYVQSPSSGISAMTSIVSSYSSGSRNFSSFLEDWFIANTINDITQNAGRWGYKSFPGMTPAIATEYVNPNTGLVSGGISKYGAQYLTFTGGSNLSINFDFKGYSLRAYAVKYKAAGGSPEVELVTTPTNYSVLAFGTTYNKVTFIVLQSDQNAFISSPETNTFSYTYQATGTIDNKIMELAYDSGNPTSAGTGLEVGGDTLCVYFDKVLGAKIDSIRVAVRNTLPITGAVYKYTGKQNPTPLGQKLTSSFTINGPENPSVPYPVPWTNWVKVDLKSYNLTADSPFAVTFVIPGAYPGTNRVVWSAEPKSTSHTYLYLSSQSTPQWYTITSNSAGDSAVSYMIRAYLSFGTTDASEPIELLPSAFNLEQNYPNPFNPSTVIKYNLASAGNVAIRIYDALGREIKTLISADKPAGSYTVNWDGTDNSGSKVSTGIYFYRLVAGDFVQTKKMMLMK